MRPNYLAGRDYIFERLFTIDRQMQEVPEDAGIQKKNKASKDLNPKFLAKRQANVHLTCTRIPPKAKSMPKSRCADNFGHFEPIIG